MKEHRETIETVDLNFVLIPDKETEKKLIELSRRLNDLVPTDFVLDGQYFSEKIAHLSLYPNRFPAKNFYAIEESMSEIAKSTRPTTIQLHGYSRIAEYLFIDAVKSPELANLHCRTVETLNPLRENQMLDILAGLTGLSPERQAMIERYGGIVLEEYVPHITLSHSDEEKSLLDEALGMMPNVELSFNVDSIHLSRFGKWGTCPEILENFPFGGR